MKKLLYSFMALFLLGSGLVACGDDEESDYHFDTPAQVDAQGTFAGTFIRVQVGTTDTLQAEGSLTLTATDTLNRAYASFASETMTEFATSRPVALNIAHADQGFKFYNKSSDNALVGVIDEHQNITASFTKAVRQGRTTRRYNYEFTGKRQ